MLKRFTTLIGIALLLLGFAACTNKKVSNPIAQVDSKQPDKILFDRAMDALKHNKFDVARLTLQTLINTYPDSEYVARAKLAIGDSWYAEGGSAALAQAENEYKDFQTFFPNMPEAAEAQLKIANIHYRQMEKPDRDFTHALRAEEEYRQLIIQYPDSKLVPEAKQRLLQVQEVLAEREFLVGKFYYMRESWAAAVARLKSLVDTYPLYSGIDEALFMLGNAYQREADAYRNIKGLSETVKGGMIKQAEDNAANAYDRILTRYPVMARAEDAKKALEAMHRPVPTPTPEAIALNKKEQESRGETGMWGRIMNNLHKGPDMAAAVKVGEPTLVDPPQTGAPQLIRQANEEMLNMMKAAQSGGGSQVTIQPVKMGTPPPNEPAPRSDSGAANNAAPATDSNGIPELQPIGSASDSGNSSVQAAPIQMNEVQTQTTPASDSSASASSSSSATSSAAPPAQGQDKKADPQQDYSTSKKKQKKGLHKLIPF
jgi:outer membrane protein assembly factor BamD